MGIKKGVRNKCTIIFVFLAFCWMDWIQWMCTVKIWDLIETCWNLQRDIWESKMSQKWLGSAVTKKSWIRLWQKRQVQLEIRFELYHFAWTHPKSLWTVGQDECLEKRLNHAKKSWLRLGFLLLETWFQALFTMVVSTIVKSWVLLKNAKFNLW